MKTLSIPLEEKEHQKLKAAKGKLSWRDFLFGLADKQETKEQPKSKGEML